ncbi:hypothetical protein D3C74_314590 [compost metagenome]
MQHDVHVAGLAQLVERGAVDLLELPADGAHVVEVHADVDRAVCAGAGHAVGTDRDTGRVVRGAGRGDARERLGDAGLLLVHRGDEHPEEGTDEDREAADEGADRDRSVALVALGLCLAQREGLGTGRVAAVGLGLTGFVRRHESPWKSFGARRPGRGRAGRGKAVRAAHRGAGGTGSRGGDESGDESSGGRERGRWPAQ